jgi:hypothetical protein
MVPLPKLELSIISVMIQVAGDYAALVVRVRPYDATSTDPHLDNDSAYIDIWKLDTR